ncbi:MULTISPECIES: hypothetical protein [unclassified Cryobacterium]|uniref:hypothetical protein n=1 Tax=unclassified Cryobacterium TaxID=2649013 RepID=UPI002AB570AD|nr:MULTISPECIES: hypothetical protein [unclassified Cryobacterium]MDY7541181.1 hypothetical protein [Cryobacterium sp. 5B3]MEA9998931.1 hypothetical protein [Cryobacterium sp. RTS3]MEB0267072.1 hypothetical protein [Cryobacterium sp. 10I5]MEB0274248.1 hypothetical protein [Cryobacterium sp. 5B3]
MEDQSGPREQPEFEPNRDEIGPDSRVEDVDSDPELTDLPHDEPPEQPKDAVTTKVCSRCSVQSQTNGAFCPNCGRPFDHSRAGRSRTIKIVAIALAALVVLGGGATAIALSVAHNNEVVAQEVAAKQAQADADAESKRVAAAAAAKKAADDAKRALRKTSVAGIETSITADAQKRVTDGVLQGPITRSSCTPLGGGSTDDLTAITTTFTCIAVNVENADGSASGYRFSATMNWDDGSYTWHLGD